MLNPHIFRAYDVRGRVGSDINPEVFRLVGRAYGTLIRNNGGRTMAVGQDNRESSAGLKAGFVEGARAAGLDIVDIGIVTTPILYFATAHWRLDGGANITGSHNPVDYNGVKMVHPGAAPLSEDEIQSLRRRIEAGALASGQGTLTTRSPRDDYFQTLAALVKPPRRLRVVADAGNGIAGVYGPELLRPPGAKIVFDVKSSQSLVDDITQHGGVPVMWKTGHSHLKRKMRDDKILLGGEVSGHMFFGEGYYAVDDGILAACKIVEIV